MPTSYLHLPIAHAVAQHLGIADLPAFLYGSVAPDWAQLFGRPRAETHFWTTDSDVSGALRLLAQFPQLRASRLDVSARTFMAGYLCHLVTDEQWTFCLWRPYFGLRSSFAGGPEGIAFQNLFRQVLDDRERNAKPDPNDLASLLSDAEPVGDGLLPWLSSLDLEELRAVLLQRIAAKQPLQPTDEHARAIAYVRLESITDFRQRAEGESVKLVGDYLAGRSLRPPLGTEAPVTIAT